MSDLLALGWSIQRRRGFTSRLSVFILAIHAVHLASSAGANVQLTLTAATVWIKKGDNFDLECESPPFDYGGFLSMMHGRPGGQGRQELARLTSNGAISFLPGVNCSEVKGSNSARLRVTARMEAGRDGHYHCVFRAAPGQADVSAGGATMAMYDPQSDDDVSSPRPVAGTTPATSSNDKLSSLPQSPDPTWKIVVAAGVPSFVLLVLVLVLLTYLRRRCQAKTPPPYPV